MTTIVFSFKLSPALRSCGFVETQLYAKEMMKHAASIDEQQNDAYQQQGFYNQELVGFYSVYASEAIFAKHSLFFSKNVGTEKNEFTNSIYCDESVV